MPEKRMSKTPGIIPILLVLAACITEPHDDREALALGYIAGLASQQVEESVEFRGFIANGTNGQLIPRITFIRQTGSRLSYVDSGTDGLSVTVLRAGFLDVQYTHWPTAGNQHGISRNADFTATLTSLAGDQVVGGNNCAAGNFCEVNAVAQSVSVGDVIRPHYSGVNIVPFSASHVVFRVLLRSR